MTTAGTPRAALQEHAKAIEGAMPLTFIGEGNRGGLDNVLCGTGFLVTPPGLVRR